MENNNTVYIVIIQIILCYVQLSNQCGPQIISIHLRREKFNEHYATYSSKYGMLLSLLTLFIVTVMNN